MEEESKVIVTQLKQPVNGISQRLITMIADEVAKTMEKRLPSLMPRRRVQKKKTLKIIENAMFLDTSAIIDGRIFDVINLGLFSNTFVVPQSILRELKHIADSQDMVRRERGRRGLEYLEKMKKAKIAKLVILEASEEVNSKKALEVDEQLIKLAKAQKGRVLTCDYNLEKKAAIEGVSVINMNALANTLKVTAVPGEALHISVQHTGKDTTQGVGYLDDGTMIVIEEGSNAIGQAIDVVVSRIIQTATGRILFAKKI